DWSSDVCSSDLNIAPIVGPRKYTAASSAPTIMTPVDRSTFLSIVSSNRQRALTKGFDCRNCDDGKQPADDQESTGEKEARYVIHIGHSTGEHHHAQQGAEDEANQRHNDDRAEGLK